jgi:hypothetical protein
MTVSCSPLPFVALLGIVLLATPAGALPGNTIQAGPYLQDATPTSTWVCWETSGTGPNPTESRVDYGTDFTLSNTANGNSFPSSAGTVIHQTPLTGLTPNTTYYYQVTTGNSTSTLSAFHTQPSDAADTPWRFAAVSDTQRGSDPYKHREVIEEGIIAYTQANYGLSIPEQLSFLINVGDLVSTGSSHSDWQDDFFAQAGELLRQVPLYPVLGNHEANASLYFEYMHLPNNGTPGYEEHWYTVDHQNVRLIGMDTNSGYTVQAQLTWLDGALAEAGSDDNIDFVFVQFHHPHKSELWTPGESGFSTQIVARVEQFSTDTGKPSIHFFGHTHGYSRGQSRDHNHLMVNVATGMGSVDYWYAYPQADYLEFQYSVPEWGFVMVDVEAGADPKFTLRRISRGNDYIFYDNQVMDEITVRRFNTPPATPLALTPNASSGFVPGWGVELAASPFSDPDGDTLLESHWQVTTTSGDYSAPVVDDWRRIENFYRPDNGAAWYSVDNVVDPAIEDIFLDESLPGCTPVHWRVRYRDSALQWSAWSEEQTFQVGQSDSGAFGPQPADGASGIALTPTLTWSPCLPTDSFDVYFGTGPNLGPADLRGSFTESSYFPGLLQEETAYYWRVDFVTAGQTETGATWSFTTHGPLPTAATAEWRFDDASPATGQPLQAALGSSVMTPRGMAYGSDWWIGPTDDMVIPHIGGEEANYIHLDNVYGSNTGLETYFNAPGNGNGGCCDVEQFTLIYDLYFDVSQTELQALWQGNATNSNDAEFFVNCGTGGFWVAGTGHIGSNLWDTGEWVRIAHRVDYPNSSAVFVNGVKVLSDAQLSAPDWLYGQGTGLPVWMLTDNNGGTDVAVVQCANLALVDDLLPDAVIAGLGGPRAAGIFVAPDASRYCFGSPNSFSLGCVLDWEGSSSLMADDLRLIALGSVPSQFGLFYYGPQQTQVLFGDGFRCVGSGGIGIFRLRPILQADATGRAHLDLDLTASSGAGQILPGSSWNFQYWYRDPLLPGGANFNLSDALEVLFRP